MMNVEKGYYVLEGLLFFHLKFYVFMLITGSSFIGGSKGECWWHYQHLFHVFQVELSPTERTVTTVHSWTQWATHSTKPNRPSSQSGRKYGGRENQVRRSRCTPRGRSRFTATIPTPRRWVFLWYNTRHSKWTWRICWTISKGWWDSLDITLLIDP